MTVQENITPQKILDFIRDYRREHNFVPSQSIIARELKMTRQNVRYYFHNMAEELKEFPEYKRYRYNHTKQKGTPDVPPESANAD